MEKGAMSLLSSESLRRNKQVFSIKIRNKTAYACQQSKVGIASENSCNHACKKDVRAKIQ
jgi:hypothetical protein